jgi:hypothetical protein
MMADTNGPGKLVLGGVIAGIAGALLWAFGGCTAGFAQALQGGMNFQKYVVYGGAIGLVTGLFLYWVGRRIFRKC